MWIDLHLQCFYLRSLKLDLLFIIEYDSPSVFFKNLQDALKKIIIFFPDLAQLFRIFTALFIILYNRNIKSRIFKGLIGKV